MEVKSYLKSFACFFITVLFLFTATSTFATNGTISVTPGTGNYANGQLFSIAIKIDGEGTSFNAAKATVTTSSTINIQGLSLGDCGFAFVKTPTKGDPSFAGVILGGSTKNCIVFTLQLKAVRLGTGNVTISDASIKSYSGANELLSSIKGGSYIIAEASSSTVTTSSELTPTQAPLLAANGIKQYDISYTVSLPNNIPVSEVSVILDPELPDKMTAILAQIPDNPATIIATFQDVPEGVHTITTFHKNKPLSTQIVNVTGANRNLEFGITAKRASPIWIWYVLTAVIIGGIGIAGLVTYLFYRKKISQKTNPPQ